MATKKKKDVQNSMEQVLNSQQEIRNIALAESSDNFEIEILSKFSELRPGRYRYNFSCFQFDNGDIEGKITIEQNKDGSPHERRIICSFGGGFTKNK